jgi:Tfp pilus assembly protein PilZ
MPRVVVEKVRIPFVQRATVSVNGVSSSAFIVDLGMEGVFVETTRQPALREEVAVRFCLPGNAIPLEARGPVAWVHEKGRPPLGLPSGFGMRFVEMDAGHRARLHDFLDEYCRRGSKSRRFARPWPTAGALGGEP